MKSEQEIRKLRDDLTKIMTVCPPPTPVSLFVVMMIDVTTWALGESCPRDATGEGIGAVIVKLREALDQIEFHEKKQEKSPLN